MTEVFNKKNKKIGYVDYDNVGNIFIMAQYSRFDICYIFKKDYLPEEEAIKFLKLLYSNYRLGKKMKRQQDYIDYIMSLKTLGRE